MGDFLRLSCLVMRVCGAFIACLDVIFRLSWCLFPLFRCVTSFCMMRFPVFSGARFRGCWRIFRTVPEVES